jgi:trk system potassium uptake protein TrkH
MGFNYNSIMLIMGKIFIVSGLAMTFPLLVAIIYGEKEMYSAFYGIVIPAIMAGIIITMAVTPSNKAIRIRDGFLIVALVWILVTLLGAFPFVLSEKMSFVDSFFEMASGFSTTGASILTDIESMPYSILFWRSFTHWLGGLGIVIFAIAIMPQLNIGGFNILRAETPGPTYEKISPKFKGQARILFTIYLILTIAETLLLKVGGLNWFDALVHTFGTVGTGGFSSYNDSLGHFQSTYVSLVVTLFMVLSALNFTLYYTSMKRGLHGFFKDSEFRFFMIIIFVATALISLNLFSSNLYDLPIALRESAFQVASVITTTGYATVNYDLWPTFSKAILFCLMMVGGCSGSTGGGLKAIRALIILRFIRRGILVRLHPSAVCTVRLGPKTVPGDVVTAVGGFSLLYVATIMFSAVIISFDNHDMVTSLTAAMACIGSIGPGFGGVGPAMNYSIFSDPIKIFLSFLMLAGRLELFTLFMLFTPKFWNRNS